MKTAILIFGLDGATWKLLGPWLKAGHLPFLQSLVDKGSAATLESTIPPLTSTAWTTFQTGTAPIKHGIFGFHRPDGKLYGSNDIRQLKFWQIAADYGKRSAIINMPLTYPIQPNNGCLVSSFLTPSGADFAYPRQLQLKLLKLRYQIDLPSSRRGFAPEKPISSNAQAALHRQILSLIASREKAALAIAKQEAWDIFFVLFKATDLSQHFFWNQKQTLKVYQSIDRAMAKIVNAYKTAHPKTKINILVISDHGFHIISKYDISLYQLVAKLGFLPRRPGWYLKILRAVRKICKWNAISRFAFPSAPKVASYGLYWPQASSKTVDELAKKLTKASYRGRKIFQEVKVVNPPVPSRPRILWLTNPIFAPNADPLSGRLIYRKTTFLKAHHYSDRKGIFIAAGPNIKPLKSKASLRLVDIAGNVLRILGIAPPAGLDSRLLPRLFTFSHSMLSPVQKQSKIIKPARFEKKDDAAVIQRLKDLGYVD